MKLYSLHDASGPLPRFVNSHSVFLLYVTQLAWTICGAGIFLVGDRKAVSKLSHAPGLGDDAASGESEAPPSMTREVLGG